MLFRSVIIKMQFINHINTNVEDKEENMIFFVFVQIILIVAFLIFYYKEDTIRNKKIKLILLNFIIFIELLLKVNDIITFVICAIIIINIQVEAFKLGKK